MEYRIEKDSMGEIHVPKDKLWGAQTQRSFENFRIGIEKIPYELVGVFATLKKAAAIVNHRLNILDEERTHAIVAACDEVLAGKLDGNFPLSVWQTGSGTQFNMNVNEVIAHRANQLLTENGKTVVVHPNDHVNKSQSSNDIFPTAIHVAGVSLVIDKLLPAIAALKQTLQQKSEEYNHIIKIGRTHLMDATPLTFGQEISGWVRMLERNEEMLTIGINFMRDLAMGGTAVGTGINSPVGFGELIAAEITKLTEKQFHTAPNKFHALTSKDEVVAVHGIIKALAADLMKIANDVRWLASGPRCGIGEIKIPENEPGSSIMPAKVNPTQSEALTMVVAQVFGNDTTISFAASQGNFQLNVFMPVLVYNLLQSINLLADGIHSFNENCAIGIQPKEDVIDFYLHQSLILITGLVPLIGYDKAAQIAKRAAKEGITLKESALATGEVSAEQYDLYMNPAILVKPR
ncbi:class II fumarate hydratase [Pelosinus fermentans]|uniref:Fumarate hydratase class II n=1 Tax=Pelosinus fermentans JBW45 TaxID=1192197 RepID=I9DHM3_9FIRM|nr:class II fumarate hydratase [Pelosinus fermentans]AJQ28796.1 Fumarate hydratase class II [Pelosinus fermentans JBW45]